MTFPLLNRFFEENEVPPGKNMDKGMGNDTNIKLVNSSATDSLLSEPERIEEILNKYKKKHALLTVEINDKRELCSSLFLEVNLHKQYLVIDEFCPNDINNNIKKNDYLTISCNNSGTYINFNGKILDVSEEEGAPYYKLSFPDVIEYSQRRQSHRVPINISSPIKVVFNTQNNLLMHGEIRDMSLGGFSARLNPPLVERFKPNDKIPKCIIQMPDNGRIVCSVEVRRMYINPSSGIPMMGCKFTDMNKQDRRSLQQTVAKLERDLMKHIKR